MRLWVLKREPSPILYDTNDGFVIRAKDSAAARIIASQQRGDEGGDVWLSTDTSTCEELLQSGDEGIILRDFHAG